MSTLMEIYYELSFTQIIPDIREYSDAWLSLSEMFAAEDMPAMSESCRKRGEFYAREIDGEYIRLLDGSFSELIATN